MDPRLMEMRFLADLERTGAGGALSQVAPWEVAATCGASSTEVRTMLMHLLCDECIRGEDPGPGTGTVYSNRKVEDPRWPIRRGLDLPLDQLLRGNAFGVRISHAGRLRLWRLQDEMNSRRIKDAFGILLDARHFDEDLRIRRWMLGADAPLTLIMVDLDNFKAVNDTHGHGRGNEVIQQFLSLVRDLSSAYGGEAYRLGGDETCSIHPGLAAEDALVAAERMRIAVEVEFAGMKDEMVPSGKGPPTSSIGVVTCTFARGSTADLRKAVDAQVYAAKGAGRNCVKSAVI